MKRKAVLVLSIIAVFIIVLTALFFRKNQRHFSSFIRSPDISRSISENETYDRGNALENRVIGLVSDGELGSKAVGFHTETWDYVVLADLPEVTPDNYVALSSDNQRLAYTAWDEYYARRYLNVMDIETGETTTFFQDIPARTEIIKISWMPDNETILYIRNNTETSAYQTIELLNIYTNEIRIVDKGEVWQVRTATALDEQAEDYFLPGRETYLPVKYTEQVSAEVQEQWNYYLDTDDLRVIYQKYGGVRAFDFSTILNIMNVEFSAPRCSADGNTIIYSTKLERNSAPGEQTPLWVAGAIWLYHVETEHTAIIYRQEDEGAIGRVDWVGEAEACFISYYDFQGSRDNINYLNTRTSEARVLFHYTDEYYNNITLLPVGRGMVSFTSSAKDEVYSNSKTYVVDIYTGDVDELPITYDGKPIILEKFIFDPCILNSN